MREMVTGYRRSRRVSLPKLNEIDPPARCPKLFHARKGRLRIALRSGCGDRLIQNEGVRLPPAEAAHRTNPGRRHERPGRTRGPCYTGFLAELLMAWCEDRIGVGPNTASGRLTYPARGRCGSSTRGTAAPCSGHLVESNGRCGGSAASGAERCD
ncbi:hypothetical protein GCM10019016_049430 [Streptomyces prasinosporus]|uniref:Uncharacterized protein n=1 Tax=Streptomyces prasinosporus TaxID=68256 RepID=A0ABP6TSU2_9ACTN|nr:hypothetical protein GCM10010332_22700 [Streptomyces albogriseolus]